MTTQPLAGSVALVTGAGRARGIGRAIALCLARAGADVAVSDLARPAPHLDLAGVGVGDNPDELEATAELVRKIGRRSVAVPMDISDAAGVGAGVASVAESLGPVTILVNNAGTAVGTAPFDEVDDAAWETSLRVNVLGPIGVIRAVLPGMRAARTGAIVNVASTLGLAALPEYGAYVVSKHAVVGLTRLLSQELAPSGIRVNAVAPGYVVTDMGLAEQAMVAQSSGVTIDEAAESIAGSIPIGRLGVPDDVAEAVTWLAGPASTFINGAVLPVHGGQVPGFS
ncbi:SDR family NAD(P)-dependent oxidoreductase [Amycolatopsis jejuensis]|uniref:SDR family NAD(P)-dependent oxidoreductase n=1 Tax=Amycolatopsis jejuensis TaxID=330084 RepID=UPI000525D0E7|nr:SDR family oxidoreductase [Amycolatopsis jejuensis]